MKPRLRRCGSELGSAAQLLAVDGGKRPDKRRHGVGRRYVPDGKSADSSVYIQVAEA
jgi:hypothetical protein